ncbi:hypothetical protein DFH09DRAFT_1323691 [Mycena vulgaris]|nr:hypothetical protein DFH09DRAFT_1323691 [Mycena vulgaris]
MSSKRPPRRRGRAPHADDSDDDEIVRAAQTDSEDSNDSMDESDSDSDSEPVSRHLTPNTSHSPDADEKPAPFFAATPAAWSDMVDDPASLPVLTFGELDAHTVRKVRMAVDPVSEESEPVADEADDDEAQPIASSSRHSPAPPVPFARRPQSQSARQAYQHRLESDPSFVPVVGEFWGHDDRLLDKDLRSLSGWWRGRWQGRGRGMFPPRGRGRGGFAGPGQPLAGPETEPAPESPLDRTWTHDGFEEMRRREDTRARPPQPHQPPVLRGGAVRGAPSFRARGAPPGRAPGRTWFTMKPEHMWTKQHDAFLFFDPALKARPGHPPGVRVRLPGGTPTIVRALPRPFRAAKPAQKGPAAAENDFVVRLPRAGKERAAPPPPPPAAKPEPDAFVVKLRPARVPSPPASEPAPAASAPANPLQPDADGWVRPDPAALVAISSPPAGPPPALPAFYPFPPPPPPGFGFPPLPNFANSPPPNFSHTPPPGFGTPPGFNAPLPPGVGLDPRGMPYELASGRPVFLQAPVFPGFMHGPSHGHGHAHSMSLGHAPDPALFAFPRPARVEIRAPAPVPASETGQQQPASPQEGKKPKLRTGAAAFVPSHAPSPSQPQAYFPAPYEGANGYGGYVPTQYYYPYYGSPQEQPQQQQQQPTGTVYY